MVSKLETQNRGDKRERHTHTNTNSQNKQFLAENITTANKPHISDAFSYNLQTSCCYFWIATDEQQQLEGGGGGGERGRWGGRRRWRSEHPCIRAGTLQVLLLTQYPRSLCPLGLLLLLWRLLSCDSSKQCPASNRWAPGSRLGFSSRAWRIVQKNSCSLLPSSRPQRDRVSDAAAATGGYVEFDRPFTHLCVFSFSGRGKQTEREQGEREWEGREGGVVEKDSSRRRGWGNKSPQVRRS